jgi:hypothetical protein
MIYTVPLEKCAVLPILDDMTAGWGEEGQGGETLCVVYTEICQNRPGTELHGVLAMKTWLKRIFL